MAMLTKILMPFWPLLTSIILFITDMGINGWSVDNWILYIALGLFLIIWLMYMHIKFKPNGSPSVNKQAKHDIAVEKKIEKLKEKENSN